MAAVVATAWPLVGPRAPSGPRMPAVPAVAEVLGIRERVVRFTSPRGRSR